MKVVYCGPHESVVDEFGVEYRNGEPVEVKNAAHAKSLLAGDFCEATEKPKGDK